MGRVCTMPPPFGCSISAHPPSSYIHFAMPPPFGWPFPPPSSAPGTSPDVSGRRAPLCSLPSSCIVGAIHRGTPRRGKLLTPSSKVPGGCTDTAHQLLSNAPAFHTHRRLFLSTYAVATPLHGPPLQLETKEPMGSIGRYTDVGDGPSGACYGRRGWALRGTFLVLGPMDGWGFFFLFWGPMVGG